MRTFSIPALALLLVTTTAAPAAAVDSVDSKRLRDAVTVNGILGHARVLQRIANDNGGTRASGTPGFAASAAYVRQTLAGAGYTVREQSFTFPFFQELAPATLAQTAPARVTYETATFDSSGSGDVTGRLVPTNDVLVPPPATPGSSSGCEASDFPPASATEPQIALIQRGTCGFGVKASNAVAAGYDAVVIFNEGQPGRQGLATGGLGAVFTVPIVAATFADGAALYAATQAGPVTARVTTSTRNTTATTTNVLADTPGGDPNRVLVAGAHLDSVAAGPGINDNGSGVSTLLETARQLSALKVAPRQKVRFAFWAAEEAGLLGSQHYVSSLGADDRGTIFAYLNFDMVGSPNYVRYYFDGDGSSTGTAGPPGSGAIESIFSTHFAAQGLAAEPTPFTARSDYAPFTAAGIPAGGLFSGHEGVKTPAEAAIYGGTAGVRYDACYHLACDTIDNVNPNALHELGDAAAHGILTLAMTTTLPSTVGRPGGKL